MFCRACAEREFGKLAFVRLGWSSRLLLRHRGLARWLVKCRGQSQIAVDIPPEYRREFYRLLEEEKRRR